MITLEQFTELAHRTASRYSHRSEPARAFYTFSPEALADFHRQVCAASAQAQRVPDADAIAQFIRQSDGAHQMGAAALGERLHAWIASTPAQPAQQSGWSEEFGLVLEAANRVELACYEQGSAECMAAVQRILDGKDRGDGVANEPWESIRRRLIALVAPAQPAQQDHKLCKHCHGAGFTEKAGYQIPCLCQLSAEELEKVLSELIPQPVERKPSAEQALEKVLAIVRGYLPPDGVLAADAMSEIIALVDPWPFGDPKGPK